MTKLEAIRNLVQQDHAFMSAGYVKKLSKIFGLKLSTYVAKANPQDFKGLSLWDKDGKPVDKLEGQDADRIATEIADGLGIKYREMFGRGSQLRSACEAIKQSLIK